MPPNQQRSISIVIALAGRRTDAADTDTIRFPLSEIKSVRKELHDLFIKNQANTLVCSAACGADLIALDVAGELNLVRHIIIPFSVSEFRRISVTDLPGEWGPLYDRIVSEVAAQGLLQVLGCDSNDDSAFSVTNKAIIKHAESLAVDNVLPLAVVVWEGHSDSPIDATREFLELAQEAKFTEATIKSS